ncbi:hypothetical protein DXG01_005896 [Tephrocybe rancida]|nr:hypothetical protein DXG01_005896 [Tephrocybe rancida]
MPDSNVPIEEKTADPQKIPLIERLCLYLTDAGRKNFEPDVHVHLLTSTTVIPSLVLFLGQLTTSFWEDDEDLLSASSEEVSAS